MNLLKSLRNLFDPTARIDQLISDRTRVMDDNAKAFEALKPVSDRALAKNV